MAEYIEREATCVHCIHAEVCDQSSRQIWGRMVGETECTDFKSTADVVEVRRGEWLDNGERNRDGTLKPFTISCSVCGSFAGFSWMEYCPNCGAKMDGKGEGE